MRSFIDTNVLVYADSGDAPQKQDVARALVAELLRAGTGVISTQVLHEYVNAALRKLGLPVELIRSRLALYGRFEVVASSGQSVREALDLQVLHQLSFWDALILQAARHSGCEQLLSEDLQSGAVIGGLRVVNPFAPVAAPAPVTAAMRPARARAGARSRSGN